MTLIELRRGDYATAGIYRTSESTTRSTITGIKLQVETLDESFTKQLIQTSTINFPDGQKLRDNGMSTDVFTLKGIITRDKTNNVDGHYIYLDFRYAVQYWYKTAGAVQLVWVDEESGVSTTISGMPLRGSMQYRAGEIGVFPFTMQFVKGTRV